LRVIASLYLVDPVTVMYLELPGILA